MPIDDEDRVLRRVPFENPDNFRDDGTPSKNSLMPRKNDQGEFEAVSADLESMADPRRTIIDSGRFALYALRVGDLRDEELEVIHDPCPEHDPENEAHVLIKGEMKKQGIRKRLSKKMAPINVQS